MVVVFPRRGADFWTALRPYRCYAEAQRPPRCLRWAQAAALRHVPRRHMCLEAIVNVARSLRKRHGPKQGASCWPKHGATGCQARLTALTASHHLFAPRCGGACSGPNLRPRMHPSAVSPREELCSRQQCRPRRRHLHRGRHGEKNPVPRGRHRQRPEAARTRKDRHFVAQQRRRKLSSPTVGRDSF